MIVVLGNVINQFTLQVSYLLMQDGPLLSLGMPDVKCVTIVPGDTFRMHITILLGDAFKFAEAMCVTILSGTSFKHPNIL